MKNKEFGLLVVSITLAIIFLITTAIYMIIASDLRDKTISQDNYIKELEWQLKRTEQICFREIEYE